MKRIRVPAEMLNCAMKASMDAGLPIGPSTELSIVVEAVLRYLSEHPQVPTDEQAESIRIAYTESFNPSLTPIWKFAAVEWQRRCFVQEEPEVPAEIEDLLWSKETNKNSSMINRIDECIREAYRRGLRKGEQK